MSLVGKARCAVPVATCLAAASERRRKRSVRRRNEYPESRGFRVMAARAVLRRKHPGPHIRNIRFSLPELAFQASDFGFTFDCQRTSLAPSRARRNHRRPAPKARRSSSGFPPIPTPGIKAHDGTERKWIFLSTDASGPPLGQGL